MKKVITISLSLLIVAYLIKILLCNIDSGIIFMEIFLFLVSATGIGSLIIEFRKILKYRKYIKFGIVTNAVICGYTESFSKIKIYYPIIEYTLENGEKVKQQINEYVFAKIKHKIGVRIKICYIYDDLVVIPNSFYQCIVNISIIGLLLIPSILYFIVLIANM